MDFRIWTAPIYGAVLAGVSIAAFSLARKDARDRLQARPFFWAGMLGIFLFALAVRLGLTSVELIGSVTLGRFAGLFLIAAAAYFAFEASRLHNRAELLLSAPAVDIDQALEAALNGRGGGFGVFRGKIACELPVQAPSGVQCAYFEAEVRDGAGPGKKGALLGIEKGDAAVIEIAGKRRRVYASLATTKVVAPLEVRRCNAVGQLAFASEISRLAGTSLSALAYERSAKVGDECFAVGQLRPLDGAGWALTGGGKGRPLLIVGGDAVSVGKRYVRRAWLKFGIAAGCSAAAAWLLAAFGA